MKRYRRKKRRRRRRRRRQLGYISRKQTGLCKTSLEVGQACRQGRKEEEEAAADWSLR